MPRIRTIVPEFWEDERFTNVSLPAWLLYIGMKNFADDYGVILANPVIIKSKVFPAREDIRRQQVSGWLQELIENSILVPLEYEKKSYYVMDFSSERIDKPQKSIIPEDIINSAVSAFKLTNFNSVENIREHSRTFGNSREHSGTFENIPAGEERKGEERNGEEGSITRTREDPPESENFIKFKKWIEANAPNVGKMKEPFTEAQFERIKQDFPIEVIESVLRSMHNYRELLRKYVSANLTFRKWAKKDMENERYGKPINSPPNASNSGVSDDYKRSILERLCGSSGSGEMQDD